MTFQMRQGVSFCRAGNRHFFLDREANRYFALGDRDERRFTALVDGTDSATADGELSAALSQLLSKREGNALMPFSLRHPPVCDLNLEGFRSTDMVLIARATAVYARIKLLMHLRSAGQILESFARHKAPPSGRRSEDPQLMALASAFERLRAWTREDQCLPLSLAFAHIASRMGYSVDIVLGVTPRPFGAHCWVQMGARVLNDRLTRIAAFTPIYAL